MTIRKLSFVEEDEISVAERKKQLRAYAKKQRASVVNRDVKEALLMENFSAAYQRIFSQSIGAGTHRVIFVYLSFSSEAPTHALMERLLEAGHTVLLPRVEDGNMVAVRIDEDTEFVRSDYGILEPLGQAYQGDVDLAVVPFLAVDEQGNRLGYGGGYYDKFLQDNPHLYRMAYGFACQVVKGVPVEQTDVRMHCVVTEEKVLWIAK